MPTARNLRDGTITLKDGGANTLEIVCEEGNLSFEETHNHVQVMDRGNLCHLRPGAEEAVTLSFGVQFQYFVSTGAEDVSPYEFFSFTGAAAAFTSTNDDGGDVNTIDVQFDIVKPGGGFDERLLFTKVPTPNFSFEEGEETDSLSFEGFAFITAPTITRFTTTTTTTA